MLAALAQWADDLDVDQLFLQVECDYIPAFWLYGYAGYLRPRVPVAADAVIELLPTPSDTLKRRWRVASTQSTAVVTPRSW